ncbi:DNA cytosine methyltransferase [Marinactinospora endophytica]
MITVSDFFCGAGGSSQGMHAVPGVEHDCADISQVDFRRYPRTDLLWASPECTNHSIAQGRRRQDATPDLFGEVLPDAAAERSRATMWDVPRYLEVMAMRGRPVTGGVVENVVDARRWVMWDAWTLALRSLGYTTRVIYLNSMFAHAATTPWAPQSRDRLYVVYWHNSLGRIPNLEKWTRPHATCPEHGAVRAVQAWKKPDTPWGRYRAQYVYRCPVIGCWVEVDPVTLPAASVIDWTNTGERIGDRARPLAAKTLARIEAGLAKYGGALAVPVEGRDGKQARPIGAPLRTQTARLETALAIPPFLVELRGGGSTHRPVSEPLATVCASGNHHGLLVPYSGNGYARPTSNPVGAVATPAVEDCRFRMLTPAEIQAAMAFAADYRVLGTRREQVRQLGNGVTPPAAEVLVSALVEAITGEEIGLAA